VAFGQMMAGGMQGGSPQTPGAADPMAKLAQLKKMLDGGLINQDEYDTKKKDILAQM